ncbi:MAG TPA: fumarylacetoacetate hydrolase family protein [Microbacteriaceae bacterium]
MRFGRLGDHGAEVPVVVTDGGTYDLRGVVADIDAAAFESGALARVPALVDRGELPVIGQVDALRIGAPIARPGAVYCVGMNYAAHAAESGSAPPEIPILFLKPSNTVVGPHDHVDIPRRSTKTDWEVELGVVIGSRALYLDSPADAAAHIAGFVVVDDLSERDFQLAESGGQWSKGKSAPGFCPTGPWLVTPDEVNATALGIRSWVNGEPRQNSNTADLIFDVNHIVWHLSQYLALEAGDLILTGTPEGVALSGRFPYLVAGDIVEMEIDGLGRQRTVFGGAPESGAQESGAHEPSTMEGTAQ